MRREWIEIAGLVPLATEIQCLPPCGGSGLKCYHIMRMTAFGCSLPPCGGSGLKCSNHGDILSDLESPSMRREWIEMQRHLKSRFADSTSPSMRREWIEIFRSDISTLNFVVSLHAEGVD